VTSHKPVPSFSVDEKDIDEATYKIVPDFTKKYNNEFDFLSSGNRENEALGQQLREARP
jgi:hypothetical protein